MMNKDAKMYLDTIFRNLCIPNDKKKILLRDLEDSVEIYLEENPDATYEELVAEFGSAEDIFKTWTETNSSENLVKDLKNRKRRMVILIAGVIAVILLVVAFLIIRHREVEPWLDGYYVETISELEEWEEPPDPSGAIEVIEF
jgi:hypothetical protein